MPSTRLQALRSWRPWLGLAVTLILSLITFSWSMHEDRRHARDQFEADATLLQERIARRMAFHEQLLRAGAESISQREALPTKESWSHYVNSLDLTSFGMAYRSFGVVAWHPASPVAEAGGNAASAPQAAGTSAVVTVEPLHDQSQGILGRNLYAEPLRRAAMARACDRNRRWPIWSTSKQPLAVTRIRPDDRCAGTGRLPGAKPGMCIGVLPLRMAARISGVKHPGIDGIDTRQSASSPARAASLPSICFLQ